MSPWLLGGVAALFGIGVLTVNDFERAAKNDIANALQGENKKVGVVVRYPNVLSPALGEASSVTIKASQFSTEGLPFFTEPKRSQKGKINHLKLELTDFYLRDLHVESLIADIPDCRFDFAYAKKSKKIRLSRSGSGTSTVRIQVADLAPFILKKYAEIKDVTVATEGEWVRVKGSGQFLIFNAAFDVKAHIKTDGERLFLADAEILFDGKKGDQAGQDTLMQTLNPVVDFAKDLDLLDAVEAKKVEILGSVIQVTGNIKVPIKPQS
jgi:hypothetical protein